MSGPGFLCRGLFRRYLCRSVGAWRFLCRGPALLASGPGALCRALASGPGGPLPRLYVPGFGGLCVGSNTVCLSVCLSRPGVRARRSICRGPARFVSGVGAETWTLCVGPRALWVGARRSFYWAPALSVRARTISVSELGVLQPGLFLYRNSAFFSALCVGARRSPAVSLCQDPALCVGVCVGARWWSLFLGGFSGLYISARRSVSALSGPGALCRGPLRRGPLGPGALYQESASGPGGSLPRLSLLRRGGLCVGPFSGSVSGPGGHLPSLFVTGPGAFCVGARRALCVGARHSLCRGPALLMSGPGAFCVGARRSLCRGPALFGSGPGALSVGAWRSVRRGPALCLAGFNAFCQGAFGTRIASVSELGAFQAPVCLPTHHHLPSVRHRMTHPALRSVRANHSANPRATHPASSDPPPQSAMRAPVPICVPPMPPTPIQHYEPPTYRPPPWAL